MHVALPLLRFSPFNNASALQKRTTRVTRATDYWIYWQFVVVLVVLVVSVATQTQNKSPSLSPSMPSMPSCGTFQCPHEGNTCRRCGPKPQVQHKCIGLPHLGGWNLESPAVGKRWLVRKCCVQNMPSWSKLQFWKTWITPALPHPNWAEKKLVNDGPFFDLRIIRVHQISYHDHERKSHRYEHFSNNFCVTSGANHKRFTLSFLSTKGG